jgi:hypothetical protein
LAKAPGGAELSKDHIKKMKEVQKSYEKFEALMKKGAEQQVALKQLTNVELLMKAAMKSLKK